MNLVEGHWEKYLSKDDKGSCYLVSKDGKTVHKIDNVKYSIKRKMTDAYAYTYTSSSSTTNYTYPSHLHNGVGTGTSTQYEQSFSVDGSFVIKNGDLEIIDTYDIVIFHREKEIKRMILENVMIMSMSYSDMEFSVEFSAETMKPWASYKELFLNSL